MAGNTSVPPYTTCVAVSTSPDATGELTTCIRSRRAARGQIPNWGTWTDGYYKAEDLYDNSGTVGSKLCAYNRTKMLAGDPSAEEICFQMSALDAGIAPADVDSSVPPPAGQDELFATLWDPAHMSVYSLHPDFANPGNSVVTGYNGSQLISLPAFSAGCNGAWHGYCVPQKDTSRCSK